MIISPTIDKVDNDLYIVRFHGVPVNWNLTLEDTIKDVAPNTHVAPNTPNEFLIWEITDQYPNPTGKIGIELTNISLLVWNRCLTGETAIKYTTDKKLRAAHPKQAFAIAKAYPALLELQQQEFNKNDLSIACIQKSLREGDGYELLPYLYFKKIENRVEVKAIVSGCSVHFAEHTWFAAIDMPF